MMAMKQSRLFDPIYGPLGKDELERRALKFAMDRPGGTVVGNANVARAPAEFINAYSPLKAGEFAAFGTMKGKPGNPATNIPEVLKIAPELAMPREAPAPKRIFQGQQPGTFALPGTLSPAQEAGANRERLNLFRFNSGNMSPRERKAFAETIRVTNEKIARGQALNQRQKDVAAAQERENDLIRTKAMADAEAKAKVEGVKGIESRTTLTQEQQFEAQQAKIKQDADINKLREASNLRIQKMQVKQGLTLEEAQDAHLKDLEKQANEFQAQGDQESANTYNKFLLEQYKEELNRSRGSKKLDGTVEGRTDIPPVPGNDIAASGEENTGVATKDLNNDNIIDDRDSEIMQINAAIVSRNYNGTPLTPAQIELLQKRLKELNSVKPIVARGQENG